jgi:hypothetical protein
MTLRLYWNLSPGRKDEKSMKPGNKRLSPMMIGVLEERNKMLMRWIVAKSTPMRPRMAKLKILIDREMR